MEHVLTILVQNNECTVCTACVCVQCVFAVCISSVCVQCVCSVERLQIACILAEQTRTNGRIFAKLGSPDSDILATPDIIVCITTMMSVCK